jgi:hypothetical protein
MRKKTQNDLILFLIDVVKKGISENTLEDKSNFVYDYRDLDKLKEIIILKQSLIKLEGEK